MICLECGESLEHGSISCPTCGSLNREVVPGQRIECENHQGIAAVAVCLTCGKPVCGDCAVKKEGKFFCDDADHLRLYTDWKIICACESEFEADMMVTNLLNAQIEAACFSLYNHISLFWLNKRELVHIRVRNEQSTEALNLLRSLGLIENVNEQSPTS